jgi:P-type Ca2+ transporter type 2C
MNIKENQAGLSDEEAKKKLKEEGFNELPTSRTRSNLLIILDLLKEPMFVLLVLGSLIYFLIGNIQESIALSSFVLVVISITFYQEKKAKNALDALKNLSSPRALVIRSGYQKRIPGKEVVKDDLVVLYEGCRVPADGVLISSSNLLIDESLLTGESIPVRKVKWDNKKQLDKPDEDNLSLVFSGTLVISGQGIFKVYSTGIQTNLGKIGKSLKSIENQKTYLEKETKSFIKKVVFFGIILCTIVTIFSSFQENLIQGILRGIALAMAILPEEIPVILTVFLALGAWKMSKKFVLTRNLHSIQALGSATVLCVDKTGTLTQNKMSLKTLLVNDQIYDTSEHSKSDLKEFPENFHKIIEYGILSSQSTPFDTMEQSIKDFGETFLKGTDHIHNNWKLIREYPLSEKLLALSYVWESPEGTEYIITSKGSPEAIADLCHFDIAKTVLLKKKVEQLAKDGLRVIAVAHSTFKKTKLPQIQHEFDFIFVGLIGFQDQVRPKVFSAIKQCYEAGIRIIMITGDYPGTASHIGKEIGLKNCDNVLIGQEISKINEIELKEKVKNINVFARIMPDQKYLLVRALQANDEIVVMTGDGVNDAPALKAADVGIAMGQKGTDVARESSDLVLLDDDFSSIVFAVKMGRRIYDNIKKAISYVISIHVPITGAAFLPMLFGWPILLFPIHIAFLQLIIDPACAIVFEAEKPEDNIMKRPPKKITEKLFEKSFVNASLIKGVVILLIVIAVYGFALHHRGINVDEARAIAFTTLIVANLSLIFSSRSDIKTIIQMIKIPNVAALWVLAGTILGLTMILYIPSLRNIFHFDFLHWKDIIICVVAGLLGIAIFEFLKVIKRKRIQITNFK